MNEHEEIPSEKVFEIIWKQHNPDDWMAQVIDMATGEHHRVYSLDELVTLISPPFHRELTGSVEPGSGR
jgi:hypothetical protein